MPWLAGDGKFGVVGNDDEVRVARVDFDADNADAATGRDGVRLESRNPHSGGDFHCEAGGCREGIDLANAQARVGGDFKQIAGL